MLTSIKTKIIFKTETKIKIKKLKQNRNDN